MDIDIGAKIIYNYSNKLEVAEMKRVAIYTNNKRLGRKLELILRPYAIVDVLGDGEPSDGYSLIFVDPESCPELIGCGISLPYTEKGGSIRALPFLHEDVISLVCSIDEKSRGKIRCRKFSEKSFRKSKNNKNFLMT